MLYAASLPKIAIVLGVFVEIERGKIKLDSETRNQLIRTRIEIGKIFQGNLI
jgi:beta-lactamase class A